ncbi:putative membrane-bound dehydrogenase domain-containing protein [Maribacter sedimenticola]|uniref:Membrane-bound dehydrogenase domain-containing protein n=1 Tax=Maribacter sedimenticola TaxID=228956 RepID=A0ABY1SK69_9FLAO|nr:PVC-type heme-binding CxxCH protein [Maribacter sedimenticola]SNR68409.1 putative membrane-bound dehydrogenase domain-containing protein [Maribacter sedimenticola]
MKSKPTDQLFKLTISISCLLLAIGCTKKKDPLISIEPHSSIVLIGNNLGSRMLNYGSFETEMHLRHPKDSLLIRNICDGGDTPGFRPHSGRVSPWAFPGADKFQNELAQNSGSEGVFETPDEWLARLKADIVIGFFGFNESFEGDQGLENFKAELNAFIEHSLKQTYNGSTPPELVIVSPIAFEDLSDHMDVPNGIQENKNLDLYSQAMEEICALKNVAFINVFKESKKWFKEKKEDYTIDGSQLNKFGYEVFARFLANELTGNKKITNEDYRLAVNKAVNEKNFYWHNDFKIPNGVHVFGRRHAPYGPDNYPFEIQKTRELTSVRDTLIWSSVQNKSFDIEAADARTSKLPPVETNYNLGNKEDIVHYKYGEDALETLTVPEGYKVELFASEKEFPDLANPAQISFDNEGRLWVATLPSYPHYKPGDPKPNDKIIILEDTDKDGKADKQTVFADQLHLPIGFEFAPEGVYVSQGTNLKLFTDTDGDDKADKIEIVLSGFDDHDTHHAISAFCADPSGAFYMSEGIFLHTNVETSYGPVRATNGGFYRYNPQRKKLERTLQVAIPNPWGIAFDEWGQDFFLHTSGPKVNWMMPSSLKPIYGVFSPLTEELIEKEHRVRPTSGMEFISSRHFPDDVQGDMLLANSIGFLGLKQHEMMEDGTGYKTKHRQDLITSTDPNFRPVEMEFAPDGSLYVVDWHNVLIGHMQHNARDPLRDHVHGRIYRITYPSRPLVQPAMVNGASLAQLFENLKLPEYRTRYRTRRELRGRNTEEVLKTAKEWVKNLDEDDPNYDHNRLEALWVSWGMNKVDAELLMALSKSKDHRVRAAVVRVVRYMGHQVKNSQEILMQAASDVHGRVRLEAITAASWLPQAEGMEILDIARQHPLDEWMLDSFNFAETRLTGNFLEKADEKILASHLKGEDLKIFTKGKKIYETEGYCITCHQESGSGLQKAGYPTLVGQQWVLGDQDRLIKLVLHGLYGPMDIMGNHYDGQVPMMAFKGLLTDEEIAAVLTYVRNSFGNKASVINKEQVQKIREATKTREAFYTPEELLKEHPMQ